MCLGNSRDVVSFRIHGMVHGDKATCGGALLMKNGVIRAIFSAPVQLGKDYFPGLVATKIALEVFRLVGWDSKSILQVNLDCKVQLNWVKNSLQRPWSVLRILTDIDSLISQYPRVFFGYIPCDENKLVVCLAREGLSRFICFKAWW
ncbi:hypothetical protein V6N13_073470 [Hibiscus sabdariffa]